MSRAGNAGAPVPLHLTSRVAEFNDLSSVAAQLSHGDVAAVLTEPALTNIGIVLPEPGFMEGLRELATQYGALLMIDETHTFSAGPGDRGVLITPFHNMALMCPVTGPADVELHSQLFADAVDELVGSGSL